MIRVLPFSLLCLLPLLLTSSILTTDTHTNQNETKQLWQDCHLEDKLSLNIFEQALKGYRSRDQWNKKNIITIIDFTQPSTQKRLFVIDLKAKKVLHHSLVAHGKNSGENYAKSFSNKPKSKMSSLGFYVTAETYSGGHGFSLKLDGLEPEHNGNARSRAIVIHAANYVTPEFAQQHGRLGRSWGCPALPPQENKAIINTIANGSCLFIYANDKGYLNQSKLLNP